MAAGRILADVVFSQLDLHAAFGGVVPEIAARSHVTVLDQLIVEALSRSNVGLADVDGIAVTSGPGLIGGLMVGLMTAKALAMATAKPMLAVNHLEGHAADGAADRQCRLSLSAAAGFRRPIPS